MASERETALRRALNEAGLEAVELFYYPQTDSTNRRAMEHGAQFPSTECALFLAESQSEGRGRLGRSFLSPVGGIYMTLLLRPKSSCTDAAALTAATAVATARAINFFTPLRIGIKWVNDLYVNGKKLAGILTQGRVGEGGTADFVAIGIGINLYRAELGEFSDVATSIEAEAQARLDFCPLVCRIVKEVLALSADPLAKEVLEEYRERSILDGKRVKVIRASEEYSARVVGIDESFRLLLDKDGEKIALMTGEVSVRQDGGSPDIK